MSSLWFWVFLLLAFLLAMQAYYLFIDLKNVKRQWLIVEQALQKRLQELKALTNEYPNDSAKTLKKEIDILETRRDPDLSRLKQRAALECRLSEEARHFLDTLEPEQSIGEKLQEQERDIQTALRYYDIAANRYNRRFAQSINKPITTLSNLKTAPELNIQQIHSNHH